MNSLHPGVNPTLTICMPLYNEGRYLDETLTSLTNQTYRDFVIIASDNASTDDTLAIVRRHAAKDKRIITISCSQNIGAINNWRMLQSHVQSRFTMFAAGHDRYAPRFVEACLEPMLNDPFADDEPPSARNEQQIALVYANGLSFNDAGLTRPLNHDGVLDTRGMGRLQRVHTVAWFLKCCYQMYGIMRSRFLKEIYYRPVIGPDNLMMIELAFWGNIAYVPESLFYWRQTGDINDVEAYRRKLFVSESGTPSDLALERVKEVISAYVGFYEKYQTEQHAMTIGKISLLSAALHRVKLIASYYHVDENTLLAISPALRSLYARLEAVAVEVNQQLAPTHSPTQP